MPALATFRRGATAACLVALLALPARAVTIDMVRVGNSGNAGDTTGYGGVGAVYDIGKYEVTIAQYTEFLNAVAATDPYGLYSTDMATYLNVAGISQSGSSGSYTYSVINNGGSSGNRPVTFVSWFDAARFANWMQNGQGSGSTETGAYTLVAGQTSGVAPAKNPGAQFYIPTENEWYKAAYYSPVKGGVGSPGYYTYATRSDAGPGNTIGSGANQANYNNGVFAVTQSATIDPNQNYLTNVGAFTNSASYYGTFDQSGNVYEWNDLTGAADSSRGYRGGDYGGDATFLQSAQRGTVDPAYEGLDTGFRLAAPVPEPTSLGLAVAGGLAALGWTMCRQRAWRR